MSDPTLGAGDLQRSFLFGMLALQKGKTDAVRLAEAWADWIKQPHGSFATFLASCTWIGTEECGEIERLVEEEVKLRGKLPVPPGTLDAPDAKQTVPFPELNARGFTRVMQADPALGQRSRYTVSRLHGKGGLGTVYIALDNELHREVALKELNPEQAQSPDACRRFLMEAQVTGQLEHPSIVPVYELARGPSSDQLFYTMRLVRGQTLRKAIADFHQHQREGKDDPLEWPRLLSAFVNICQAVGYAHSRGVVHRDLKPENVMLGSFGEVVVLDWGLAKMVNQPDETAARVSLTAQTRLDVTQPGQALGTPAYMAPEQAGGRLDLIDHRTDIYGLGTILFEVLTGRAPHEGTDIKALLEQIIAGPTPRARSVEPAVPQALDAVCARAMALDRADRYATASALADDVQRYLADEPVSVCREPVSVRLGRWVRRHRTLVASVAALLVTSLVLLVAGLVLLGQEQARTERQKQEAERQRNDAQLQRDRARENYRLARSAVDKFLVQVTESPEMKARGLEGLRTGLLETAAGFYEKFVESEDSDPEIQAERGRAFQKLALLYAETGRGGQAEKTFKKAIDIQLRQAGNQPQQASHRADLAVSYNNLGSLYRTLGRTEDAEKAYREALALQEELVKAHPEDFRSAFELAGTHNNLGNLYLSMRRFDPAGKSYDEALTIAKGLSAAHPDALDVRQKLAAMLNNKANLLIATGKLPNALETYRDALAIQKSLAAGAHADPQLRQELATCHYNLATLHMNMRQWPEAEKAFLESLGLREKLAAAHPTVPQYQQQLATNLNNLGVLYLATHRDELAEKSFQKALDIHQRLVASHPELIDNLAALGGSYCNMANFLRDSGKPQQALDHYDRAIRLLEDFVRQYPREKQGKMFLRQSYRGRATTLNGLRRPTPALADWNRAVELGEGQDRNQDRAFRAACLARMGNHAQAMTEVAELAKADGLSGAALHALGVACSASSAAVRKDSKVPESERDQRGDRYASQAVALLARAAAAGSFAAPAQLESLKKDRDLQPIRSRPDFRKLLEDLEKKPKPAPGEPAT